MDLDAETERGFIQVKVVVEKIDLSQVLSTQPDTGHGASVSFTGYVRNHNLGKKVIGVEYDCFIPLTENTFLEIAREAQNQWGQGTQIIIIHRHGYLNIGDSSVVIWVSTKHRDESYLASRYVIEQIKTRSPIWKKEYYEDHQTEWVRGHALCQHKHH